MEKQENETQKKKERFEEFCKLHPEIKSLSETVNRDINSLARQSILASSVNIRPTPPTYTRGLYKGSLGDNVSVLSNAEKKAQYESALATYEENNRNKYKAQIESKKIAKRCYKEILELIDALEKIPGSQEFLEDAKKQRDFVSTKM